MLSMIVLKGNLNTFILIFSVYICPSIQNSQVVSRLPWYNNQGNQAPEYIPGGTQGKKTEMKLQEKCNFNLIFFDFSRYKITIEPKENIKFF